METSSVDEGTTCFQDKTTEGMDTDILVHRHYNDVIMSAMPSQITSLPIVYSTVYSGADQRKHQSSVSLAFVRGTLRWPVNYPHKWAVMRKMFPLDNVIMSRELQNVPRYKHTVFTLCCVCCDLEQVDCASIPRSYLPNTKAMEFPGASVKASNVETVFMLCHLHDSIVV